MQQLKPIVSDTSYKVGLNEYQDLRKSERGYLNALHQMNVKCGTDVQPTDLLRVLINSDLKH